ncbi:peptide chain release factor N(5)-glutamine methyltransferase [Piscinibacter sakaiensis]|uniref:peptide chain release factor N(5)-glutamine methyltransferase n=1 Tax=Piscinibacter sakaiensis TaxID=1547922 RepID=UPI003AAD153F
MSDASPQPATVADALRQARQAGLSRLDGQLLLAELLGQSRTWLIGHDADRLERDQIAAWQVLVQRRAAGEPIAYLLQRKEFFGLMLEVDRSVLVPRPDTETLVSWALEILQPSPCELGRPRCLVDLGCGSGAIALAIKHSCGADLAVTATDASADALAVAAANGRRLGLAVDWRAGDWWQAVGGRCFDIAVSNPPYIAADDPHLHELAHEPQQALVAAENGLAALRIIIAGAGQHLAAGGWLLLEHGFEQAADVNRLLTEAGFVAVRTRHDLAGQPRCTGGQWPGGAGANN